MKKTIIVSVENGIIHAIENVDVTINIVDVVERQRVLDTKLAEVSHIEIDLNKTHDEINTQVSEQYKTIDEIKSEQTALSKLLADANDFLQQQTDAQVVEESPFREVTEKEDVVEETIEEVKDNIAVESETCDVSFIEANQVKAENEVQEQERLPSSFSGWRR